MLKGFDILNLLSLIQLHVLLINICIKHGFYLRVLGTSREKKSFQVVADWCNDERI